MYRMVVFALACPRTAEMVGYGVSAPSMQAAAECLSECIPWCRPAVSTPASAKPFEGMLYSVV